MYLAGWVHLLLSGCTVSGLSTVNTGAIGDTVGSTLDQLAPTTLQFENLQLVQNTLSDKYTTLTSGPSLKTCISTDS